MVYLERAVIIWIAGWLISSIAFVAAKAGKALQSGEAFNVKESLKGIVGLLITWPVAALMYIIISFQQKKKQ